MAKQPSTTPSKPSSGNSLNIPRSTDLRAEAFYILGILRGQGFELASRLTEIVIEITAPVQPAQTLETEN